MMQSEAKNLSRIRDRIRHLLDPHQPEDALASYYALYHEADKTRLIGYPAGAERATGYVALSRTGMDLFRPLVTMRLPPGDSPAGLDLLYSAVMPGAPLIAYVRPEAYPLLAAVLEIEVVTDLQLMILDRERFEPVINVLVARSQGANGLPRYVIRRTGTDSDQAAAAAGLNWQTPYFAELSVHTSPGQRRQGWGRSVVAAMVHHVLEGRRMPLYAVEEGNQASLNLARRVGFVDSGVRQRLVQGSLRPREDHVGPADD